MGLFNTVCCERPLPDAQHQDLELQPKNLESAAFLYMLGLL
jgi:hypothetical protein